MVRFVLGLLVGGVLVMGWASAQENPPPPVPASETAFPPVPASVVPPPSSDAGEWDWGGGPAPTETDTPSPTPPPEPVEWGQAPMEARVGTFLYRHGFCKDYRMTPVEGSAGPAQYVCRRRFVPPPPP